ncbi:MAG: TlpA disulfide reductase family protein [Caldimonas sp.]
MNRLALSVGPLALPTQVVIAVVCALIAAAVGHWAGRRHRVNLGTTLLDMGLAGVVAARIAFVLLWFDDYAREPLTILDLRDGGFTAWAGLLAAGLVALWQAWHRPTLRKPLTLGLLAGALGWITAPGALRFGVDPSLVDLEAVALVTPQGHPASLATLAAGKPAVVNLWATWCPPCRREMPVLASAQRQTADTTFVFANQGEDALTTEQYLVDEGLRLDHVLLDRDKGLGRRYGSMALPITLFYDARGRLVETHLGSLSTASLASKLASLRAKPAP